MLVRAEKSLGGIIEICRSTSNFKKSPLSTYIYGVIVVQIKFESTMGTSVHLRFKEALVEVVMSVERMLSSSASSGV